MRKPAFCICENKGEDQLHGNREADQRLCFRYTDSTIPLLSKSEKSSLWPSSVAVQPGLCGTWSETPKTGFLTSRLILLVSPQISNKGSYHWLKWCPKDADGIANSEKTDQTEQSGLGFYWLPRLSV